MDWLIRLDEYLAKLTGTDAPQKVEGSLTVTVIEGRPTVTKLLQQEHEPNASRRAETL